MSIWPRPQCVCLFQARGNAEGRDLRGEVLKEVNGAEGIERVTSRMSDNAHTFFVLPEANSRVVSGFLDYLKVEKGLASLTVAATHLTLLSSPDFWTSASAPC